jgi:hypothetical protein
MNWHPDSGNGDRYGDANEETIDSPISVEP